MIIGLSGASGFIGRHFTQTAQAAGHEVVGFSRKPQSSQRNWTELDFSGLDAMVHLSGESVFGLWTKSKKDHIRESRIGETRKMVEAMQKLSAPPRILVSASGSAFYGDRADEVLTENSPRGSGFLADVTGDWETEVAAANAFARTASVRFGIVLGEDGGAWPLLRRAFSWFVGGRLGSGRQFMPWIHVVDVSRLLLFTLEREMMSGPVNGVAPEALTNAEFTAQVAKSLHRPAILPAPEFALNLLPGGMSEMFLDSARIEPAKALQAGFQFEFPTLGAALGQLVGKG